MKRQITKLLSILLALVMVTGLVVATPQTVYAADEWKLFIDGRRITEDKAWYTNGGEPGTLADNPNWNAYYDYSSGTLTLRNYNGFEIWGKGSVKKDLTINLIGGESKIGFTRDRNTCIINSGNLIINADSDATLSLKAIEKKSSLDPCGICASGSVTLKGKVKVIADVTNGSGEKGVEPYGVYAEGDVNILEDASFKAKCFVTNYNAEYGDGIHSEKSIVVNTTRTISINTRACRGGYALYAKEKLQIIDIPYMVLEWNGGNFCVYPEFSLAPIDSSYAININRKKQIVTCKKGTPYKVNLIRGTCSATDESSATFLKGERVEIKADPLSPESFEKWSSDDITVFAPTSAASTAEFIMPEKNVDITANYNAFSVKPSFAATDESKGVVSFTLLPEINQVPSLVTKGGEEVNAEVNISSSGSGIAFKMTVNKDTVPAGDYQIKVKLSDGSWQYNDISIDYGEPKAIAKPTLSAKDKIYSGKELTAEVTGYNPDTMDIRGNEATDAGTYTVEVTPKAGYIWEDGGTDPVTTTWIIKKATISLVTITGVKEPAAGEAPLTSGISADPNYVSINTENTKWEYLSSGTWEDFSGASFEKGKTYAISVTVMPDKNHKFPDNVSSLVARINGNTVNGEDISQTGLGRTIRYSFGELSGQEPKPNAIFTAEDSDGGRLTNLDDGTYIINDWIYNAIDGSVYVGGLSDESTITIVKKGNGTTTTNSDAQTINIAKASVPAGVSAVDCTTSDNNDGKIIGVDSTMEYMINGKWQSITGTEVANLVPKTYQVRKKASGTILASEPVYVTVNGYIAPIINTLSSIAITAQPTKTTYTEGENFDVNGMVVTATYSDGTTKTVTDYTFTPLGPLGAGTDTITVYYTEGSVTKTATVGITVNPAAPTPTTYSVSIVTPIANGTVVASPTGDLSAGDLVTLTVTPDPGYVLESIIVKDDGANLVPMETANTFRMPASNVSVDATFKEAPVSSHTVTFNTDGGSAVPEQTVADGATVTKPADPTKDGYTFEGWYQDATFATAFDFTTPITADITLYAKWKDNGGGTVTLATYTAVTGGNGIWTKNSGLNYELTVKRSVDDNTCFSHFVNVLIDGTVLTPGVDYDAKAGSTIVTLKASALQKLSAGKHTVTVNFDDGKVDTTLTVKKAPIVADKDTTPNTGDNNRIGMWLALMLLSLAGTCGTIVLGGKRRNEK